MSLADDMHLVEEAGADIAPDSPAAAALARLRKADVREGSSQCRKCGCTDSFACPQGCFWVTPTECSECSEG